MTTACHIKETDRGEGINIKITKDPKKTRQKLQDSPRMRASFDTVDVIFGAREQPQSKKQKTERGL